MHLRELTGKTATVVGIGVTALAVGGLGIADASNGGALLAGHKNTATKTTTIKDSKGTPLTLSGKTSKPPLVVNSKKLVTNLNAQMVGGKKATQLGGAVTVELGVVTSTVQGAANQAGGIVTCPKGQHPLGGGITPTGTADDPINVLETMPDLSSSGVLDGWIGVIGDADSSLAADDNGDFAVVFVSCTTGTYHAPNLSAAARRSEQSLRASILRSEAAKH